jgi:hypothetical protein
MIWRNIDKTSLSSFLHFGYVPKPGIGRPRWLDCLVDWQRRPGEIARADDAPSLIREGVGLLRRVFKSAIGDGSASHVVPLSGGLDSRAILGGLLENLGSREVQAVTFGSPGTWDYEIGREVARVVDVRREVIDLTSAEWRWDTAELVKTAGQTDRPIWVFDAHVNRHIADRLGFGHVYWSGFMGDPLSGSHLWSRDSSTWDHAKKRFAGCNRFSRSVDMTPPGFEPERCLPESPPLGPEGLSYDEQLDFLVRQQCWVEHIVLPKRYEYRTPFLHPEWVNFVLSLPRRYRQGQYLYKEILRTAYPRLFALPVKNNFGLPLNAPWWSKQARRLNLRAHALARRIAPDFCRWVSPGLNYIDFDHELRHRRDLREMVHESIENLRIRRVADWIDVEDIWRRHQNGQGNHADALTLLASLEINLGVRTEATA